MYSRVNYTIVGLFVLLFGAGVVFFGFWLAKYGLKDTYATYKIEMKESVSGLSKDSSVKLRGLDIGHVSKIEIDPKNIEITDIYLKIKKSVVIKEDMFATTNMMGVTGLLSIEIAGGSNGAKTLKPTDSYIPLISTKPSFVTNFRNDITKTTQKLNNFLSQSEKLLSDKNIKTFNYILINIENMTKKAMVLEDEFNTTLSSLRKNMSDTSSSISRTQKDFSKIKDVTIPTINKLMQTSKNFNRVTLKFEKSLDRGDYDMKRILEPTLVNTQILIENLTSLSREFANNPSSLLFKSRKPRRGPGE